MFVHEYTVQLCTQELNAKPSHKDMPYIHKAIDSKTINWKDLTQDQLDYLYRKSQEITSIIEAETFRRLEEN